MRVRYVYWDKNIQGANPFVHSFVAEINLPKDWDVSSMVEGAKTLYDREFRSIKGELLNTILLP